MTKKLTLFYVSVMLLLSCNTETNDTNVFFKNGGKFSSLRPDYLITNFKPTLINTQDLTSSFSCTYEGLTRIDHDNLKTIPCIAKSWTNNNNCTNFTFKIRKGIYFNSTTDKSCNNIEVNANHIKYCFDRLADTNSANLAYAQIKETFKGAKEYYANQKEGLNNIKGISGIKVIDNQTISIDLITPFCDLPSMLSSIHFSIYPKEMVNTNGKFKDSTIISTGPFSLATFNDSTYVFVKNKNYWRTDKSNNKLPYFDSVELIHNLKNKGNFDYELTLLQNKRIDIIRDISAKNIDKLVRSKDFNEEQYHSIAVSGNTAINFNVSKPPFNNINLRKAIAHCFNKELFVDSLFQGENWFANYGLFPSSKNYVDTIHCLAYNVSLAKSYINKYKKEKGINEVEIKILTVKDQEWFSQQISHFIKKGLGIKVSFQYVETIPDYFEAIYSGNFELCNFSSNKSYPGLGDHLSDFHGDLVSENINEMVNTNVYRHKNNVFDKLYDKAIQSNNVETRKKLFEKAERIIINNAITIPLYYNENSFYISSNLKGHSFNSLDIVDYALIYKSKK